MALRGAASAAALVTLTACVPMGQQQMQAPVQPDVAVIAGNPALDQGNAARNFVQVVAQVEPVSEALCRKQNPRANCDFLIVIDDRPGQPANAYQTLDRQGRPVVGFTLALIQDARNADEIAFVVGHETAHHIAGHIPQSQRSAVTGAVLAGALAQATGAPPEAIAQAQELGAAMGARTYARNYELEADALGAAIALQAGFDPVRGTAFFDRLPDPGDQFLGTHPASSQRKDVVRRVAASFNGTARP